MTEKLKPCPFCGGEAEMVVDEDDDGRFAAVGCPSCGAGSRQHYFCGDDAREYAAGAWNTRPQSDLTREGVAEAIGLRFAALVSGNRMPHMSGDPRNRLQPHVRRVFDDCCNEAADAILAMVPGGGGWRPYDKFAVKPGDYAWVLAVVVDNCTTSCGVQVVGQTSKRVTYVKSKDVRLPAAPKEGDQ